MNSARLPEESPRVSRTVMEGLCRLAAHASDNIHECFLEPVRPHGESQIDQWELLAGILSERDIEHVVRGLGLIESWKFRLNQVRIHSMYATSICAQLRQEHSRIVEASRAADTWDIQYLKQRAFRREAGILRLRFAGLVYLANVQMGERLSRSAIEAMRIEFSLVPSAA